MKSSQRKIDANRRNGRLGGPKTQAGKARSSMNAMRHGIFSKSPVIHTVGYQESEAEFQGILSGLLEELCPRTVLGHHCVKQIALTVFKFGRLNIHEKAVTERGLHAVWPQQTLLAEQVFSRDAIQTQMEWLAEGVKRLNKDCELLLSLIESGHGNEVGNHKQFDDSTYVRLEMFVRGLAINPDISRQNGMDSEIPPQDGSGSIVSGLTTTELYRHLNELLGKSTGDYLRAYRYSVPEIARSEVCLNQEIAVLPPPEEQDRIVRYTEHLNRTLERLLEQFRRAEQAALLSDSLGIADAEYQDEPSDNSAC